MNLRQKYIKLANRFRASELDESADQQVVNTIPVVLRYIQSTQSTFETGYDLGMVFKLMITFNSPWLR